MVVLVLFSDTGCHTETIIFEEPQGLVNYFIEKILDEEGKKLLEDEYDNDIEYYIDCELKEDRHRYCVCLSPTFIPKKEEEK